MMIPILCTHCIRSGRIWCHFARDNYGAFVTHSDNGGTSWSPPIALDNQVKVGEMGKHFDTSGNTSSAFPTAIALASPYLK